MDWEPHGHCFLWQPWVLWPDVFTNLLIAVSYVSLFLSLNQVRLFVRAPAKFKLQVDDNLIPITLGSFAAFIGWCGLTHVMDVIVIWTPQYEWQIIVQAVTGVLSSTTAFFMAKVALAMRQAMLPPNE